jgi:hypothetical protein
MRKSLWIILTVLLVTIGAPAAQAETVYEITFSGTGTLPSTPINFTYDQSTKELTNFNVTYDGISFDFASFINSLPNEDRLGYPCEGATTAETFLISSISSVCRTAFPPFWYASSNVGDVVDTVCFPITAALGSGPCDSENSVAPATGTHGSGFYDIALVTPAATPEPVTAVLWLTGIGLMIVMRKRLAQATTTRHGNAPLTVTSVHP